MISFKIPDNARVVAGLLFLILLIMEIVGYFRKV